MRNNGKSEGVVEASRPLARSDLSAVELVPANANKKTSFSLISRQGSNISAGAIEWYLNGAILKDISGVHYASTDFKKGDEVFAKVYLDGKELISNSVSISNSPPEIKLIKILPEVFKAGDRLFVDVSADDADGDKVTLSYEWVKNGEPAGNDKQIGVAIKRGDNISVKVLSYDGEESGSPVVLQRQLHNLPPQITESNKYAFDGSLFTYRIQATDPDDDPLTYSLKTAPPGMAIDTSTGVVKWPITPDFKGKASFTVSVTDDHGGVAMQQLNFEIR